MQKEVCQTFTLVIKQLRTLCKEQDLDVVLEVVTLAVQELEATYRPLLDGYYATEFCKEVYCAVREFRTNALNLLKCVLSMLGENKPNVCEIHGMIDEAICWLQKAKTLLCDCETDESFFAEVCSTSTSSSSCTTSTDSSCTTEDSSTSTSSSDSTDDTTESSSSSSCTSCTSSSDSSSDSSSSCSSSDSD